MLTLADLGVLHSVEVTSGGTVVTRLTPTCAGCPAVAEMRAETAARLRAAGFTDVQVDPGPAPARTWLELTTASAQVPCPRCDSADTEEISRFTATACTALRRCRTCLEPFPHVKDLP